MQAILYVFKVSSIAPYRLLARGRSRKGTTSKISIARSELVCVGFKNKRTRKDKRVEVLILNFKKCF